MEIKLNTLAIQNFKGVKKFSANFEGRDAVIEGANGVGKTTVYDAFLWLLFGKDSTGRKEFELRPLDKDNKPLKGLVLAVEASIDIDGQTRVFRREHKEKVVKKQLRGYETLSWIDEVAKKAGDYTKDIAEIIPEETFRLLTDLQYFNGKLHWTKRRETLLAIAGTVVRPAGFEDLLEAVGNRTLDEYKKVLADRKKRDEKERDEINPRIDEITKGMEDYEPVDQDNLKGERERVKGEIEQHDKWRTEMLAAETKRQTQLEDLNKLRGEKVQREMLLKNDTAGVQHLVDRKLKITNGVGGCEVAVSTCKTAVEVCVGSTENAKAALQRALGYKDDIREEYKTASVALVDDKCLACGQTLPADKLAEVEVRRNAKTQEIVKRGNAALSAVEDAKKKLSTAEGKLTGAKLTLEQAQIKLVEAEQYRDQEIPKIDKQIANKETVKPEDDAVWCGIIEAIQTAEAAIGTPLTEELADLEANRQTKIDRQAELDKALARADQQERDTERIAEYEKKEKELAQKIAQVEKLLARIDEYTQAESGKIEAAVNGKFKHTEFKLFKRLLNGEIEDCCEAMLNGTPYPDMSTGEKILVGVDIINVLSAHYEVSVPLFVDNAESLTLPLEATSQAVRLFAVDGAKLAVTQQERKAVA